MAFPIRRDGKAIFCDKSQKDIQAMIRNVFSLIPRQWFDGIHLTIRQSHKDNHCNHTSCSKPLKGSKRFFQPKHGR